MIYIFTDGGCDPNPGPGGWGALVQFYSSSDPDSIENEWILCGNHPDTTNNRMELQAAIAALSTLAEQYRDSPAVIFTDSEYLRMGITSWTDQWIKSGWKTQNKKPVRNRELWQSLISLTEDRNVTWKWIKGHAGHLGNERADRLASRARQMLTESDQHVEVLPSHAPSVAIYLKVSYSKQENGGKLGAIMVYGDHSKEVHEPITAHSSNALLIASAIDVLHRLKQPCYVVFVSDADYLVRGASQWIHGWIRRDWMTRDNKPVANRDLWEKLAKISNKHTVTWRIPSPTDTELMDRAAEIASAQ